MPQYGLIGYPLTHSFSQKYFAEKFLHDKIANAAFLNFSIPQINDIEKIFETHPQLKGLAVTIPYKKTVIDFLDEKDEIVKKIEACNCIKIQQNKKTGFNTDVIGFEKSFTKKLKPAHKKALILGTGGAASAVQFVLDKLNIEYLLVSRFASAKTVTYSEISPVTLLEFTIIINCTPLGTFPNITEAPLLPYSFLTPAHYLFDLIYNPAETKFLQYGKEKGCMLQNGYEMLVIQAEENWKIWNN